MLNDGLVDRRTTVERLWESAIEALSIPAVLSIVLGLASGSILAVLCGAAVLTVEVLIDIALQRLGLIG
jgi:hypothetical protein